MATRLYLPNSAQTTPISPTPSASWEITTGFVLTNAHTVPGGDAMGTDSFADNNAANRDNLLHQFISQALQPGQTVTGGQNLQLQALCSQVALTNNMFLSFGIRIIAADGSTVQKTVLDVFRDTVNEAATTLTNRSVTTTSAATNYTTVLGDRLVIEVGMSGDPDTGSDHDSAIRFGDAAASDLPTDDASTDDFNPWVELTDTLAFASTPLAIFSMDKDAVAGRLRNLSTRLDASTHVAVEAQPQGTSLVVRLVEPEVEDQPPGEQLTPPPPKGAPRREWVTAQADQTRSPIVLTRGWVSQAQGSIPSIPRFNRDRLLLAQLVLAGHSEADVWQNLLGTLFVEVEAVPAGVQLLVQPSRRTSRPQPEQQPVSPALEAIPYGAQALVQPSRVRRPQQPDLLPVAQWVLTEPGYNLTPGVQVTTHLPPRGRPPLRQNLLDTVGVTLSLPEAPPTGVQSTDLPPKPYRRASILRHWEQSGWLVNASATETIPPGKASTALPVLRVKRQQPQLTGTLQGTLFFIDLTALPIGQQAFPDRLRARRTVHLATYGWIARFQQGAPDVEIAAVLYGTKTVAVSLTGTKVPTEDLTGVTDTAADLEGVTDVTEDLTGTTDIVIDLERS
jgi:hypothetical protein